MSRQPILHYKNDLLVQLWKREIHSDKKSCHAYLLASSYILIQGNTKQFEIGSGLFFHLAMVDIF